MAKWHSIAWTVPTFEHAYRRSLSPQIRRDTVRAFALMCEQFVHNYAAALRRYDKIGYLDGDALELDVNRSWRAVVAQRATGLSLYSVGDHDLIERQRFTPRMLAACEREPLVSFTQIVCDSALKATATPARRVLADALDERWLYKLGSQQSKLVDWLYEAITSPRVGKRHCLLTGGPGTGKTTVLTQIADVLDWDPKMVSFQISDRVAEYLAVVAGSRMEKCRRPASAAPAGSVVLVDDPETWFGLSNAFGAARYKEIPVAIVATDLAQVTNVVSDNELKVFLGSNGIQHSHLTECYRQTAGVGETSLAFLRHISARFTKHLIPSRIKDFARRHALSVESANNMKFVVSGGYSKVYADALQSDIDLELEAILQRPLWKHWFPLCIVLEDHMHLESADFDDVRTDIVKLSDVDRLRGVEYQHVFVMLTQDRLHELMVAGHRGLDTQSHLEARNLRIPFSRATDTLVVFGLGERYQEGLLANRKRFSKRTR